jgi:Fe2+ or Zn2+ uptake regulation protein
MQDRPNRDEVREMLREHGLRYSRPRAAILGFFAEQDRHVSAEDLYVELKRRGSNLSLSTVYLNLNVLSDAGVVREFQGSQGQKLYDSNVTPHYHLICRDTGEVRDVPAPTVDGVPLGRFLKRAIEEATGWEVEEPQLQLRGRSPAARDVHGEGDSA